MRRSLSGLGFRRSGSDTACNIYCPRSSVIEARRASEATQDRTSLALRASMAIAHSVSNVTACKI